MSGLEEGLHLPRKGKLRRILEKGISTEGWGGDAEKQTPAQGCHQPFFSARVTPGDKWLWQRPPCTWGHRDGGPGSKDDLTPNRLLTGRGSQTPLLPASSPHPRGHRRGRQPRGNPARTGLKAEVKWSPGKMMRKQGEAWVGRTASYKGG